MDLGARADALGVEAVEQLNDYEKVQLALALADDAYRTTDPPAGVADDLEGACERLVRARGAFRRREGAPDWHETDADVDADATS